MIDSQGIHNHIARVENTERRVAELEKKLAQSERRHAAALSAIEAMADERSMVALVQSWQIQLLASIVGDLHPSGAVNIHAIDISDFPAPYNFIGHTADLCAVG